MVVALVALFVALGGSSYAAFTITGKNIKNGTITGKDVKKGSLTGKQIKSGSITGKQIANDTLTDKQIKLSSFGKVPSAVNADHAANADKLGGKSASDFGGPVRWILIQGTTTGATKLADSGGFGDVTRTGTGVYNIDTGQSAVKRPLTATLNIGGLAGLVDVAPCGGNANNPGGLNCPGVNDNTHVLVRTLSTAAAAADRTFYLVIGS